MSFRDSFHIPRPDNFDPPGILQYAKEHTDYFLILLIILFNGIIAINLVFRIYIAKNRNNKRRYLAKETMLDTEDLLAEYLGEAISLEQAVSALNRLIHNKNKPIESIASVFRSYFQMLSGDSKGSMITLFSASNMANCTLKKLKNPDEHVILYIELSANAKFIEAKQDLKKLLKNGTIEVKFEALCALVDLFKFNALGYMLEVKYKPSEWEEMILMQKLQRSTNSGSLNLEPFLKSDNYQLIRFAVRAAQQFNHFEVAETFKALLESDSISTRKSVYEAAGSLLMNELQHEIIACFEKEQLANRRLILKTLSKLGDEEAYPFLEETFKSKIPELSLLAGKAIYTISNKSGVLEKMAGDELDLNLMLDHIKDPLIA